jgi:hypothetical protein
MAEWSKAVDSKSTVGVTPPGVQIPLSPPVFKTVLFFRVKEKNQKKAGQDCLKVFGVTFCQKGNGF